MKNLFTVLIALVIVVGLSVFANATLIDMGDGTIYDTDTQLSWLKDAGMGGLQTWPDAMAWADNLVYAGFSDWRLPTTDGICAQDFFYLNCSTSEMGHLYYTELGNSVFARIINIGPFNNLYSINNPFSLHWTDSVAVTTPPSAFEFAFYEGIEHEAEEIGALGAWAVRASYRPVPEPGTLMLLGTGLAGVVVWRKREVSKKKS